MPRISSLLAIATRTFATLVAVLAVARPAVANPIIVADHFDNLTAWEVHNNSSPLGKTSWFQGNDSIFSAYDGASDSYAAANYLNAAEAGGDISDWLISPIVTVDSGDSVSFATRSAGAFPDRLELRMNAAGTSTNVGSSATSLGDFTTLLLSVNPSLADGGYPTDWTLFSVALSGLGGATPTRFAFRYYVDDTSAPNGDYVGIDAFSVTAAPVPEPSTLLLLGTGMVSLARAYRRAGSRTSSK